MLPKYEERDEMKRLLQLEYARIVKSPEIKKDDKKEPMEYAEYLWDCIRYDKEIKGYIKQLKQRERREDRDEH